MAYVKNRISANLNALLETIAWAEGTSRHSLTVNDGYDVIVTGVGGALEVFTDYSQHPFTNRKPKQINNNGLFSTASGRYQHMKVHAEHYRKQLKLDQYGLAFGPEAQDVWAIQLIREFKALPFIEKGMFEEAIVKIAPLWASLPGKGYPGQAQHSMSKLKAVYIKNGGLLWNQSTLPLPQSLQLLPLYMAPIETENVEVKTNSVEKPKLNLLQKIMLLFKKNPKP